MDAAKAKPNSVNYATVGYGAAAHLFGNGIAALAVINKCRFRDKTKAVTLCQTDRCVPFLKRDNFFIQITDLFKRLF